MILRYREGRYSTVEPLWRGETVCVIGGGKSLNEYDVDLTKGRCKVIVVNDGYLMAPWADICYFADAQWWNWHKDKLAFKAFEGQKCTIEHAPGGVGEVNVDDTSVHALRNYGTQGLSTKPDGLCTGQNGGYQAINLAVLGGAKRVLLLGFDMKPGHWFGNHMRPSASEEQDYKTFIANFVFIQNPLKEAGCTVINCTPGSALETFPKMPINEALSLSDQLGWAERDADRAFKSEAKA